MRAEGRPSLLPRRRLTIVVAAALLVASPRMGGAAPARRSSDRDVALSLVAQAAKAFDAGDYVLALSRFEEAYALVPSPNIQYNLGLTYAALGRFSDGLRAFDRFLAEAHPNAENRSEARTQIDRLRRRVAMIDVSCDEPGAEVVVSGRPIGTTPLPGPFPVDPGVHDLAVRKEGRRPDFRQFVASGGALQSFRITLASESSSAPPPTAVFAPPRPAPDAPTIAIAPAAPAAPGPSWQRIAAMGAGVAGLGLATIGGVFMAYRSQRLGQFDDYGGGTRCSRDRLGSADKVCRALYEDARSKEAVAIKAFVGGGAALLAAGGLALWAIRAEAPPRRLALACAPDPTPGLACALAF